MKFRSIVILMWVYVISFSHAQENKQLKSTISTDFGSYRNRYLYPITNIIYTTSLRNELLFYSRIRSYGTLFYFSKTAYDITPILEYKLLNKTTCKLFVGIGSDMRIRLEKDSRGTQVSSIEPLVSINTNFHQTNWILNTPLWTRFYNNGVGFTILPEIKYKIHSIWSLYGRYEFSVITNYKSNNYQFHQDCFIGIQKNFN